MFHHVLNGVLPKRCAIERATSEPDDRNKDVAGAIVPAYTARLSLSDPTL